MMMSIMADIFLERDIFPRLLKWAARSNKGLFLRGPRQAGKTRTLMELAKSEAFPGFLYVNLRDEEIKTWWDSINGVPGWYEKFEIWLEKFKIYDVYGGAPFSGERKPLVILDEIQESPRMFNSIRDIVREQKVKLVATGSYLGIAEFENYFSKDKRGYFYPSGDVEVLQMYTMTYREVVRACEQVNSDSTKDDIFKYYFQYGGYPEVVATWLKNRNFEDCYNVLENIYSILVKETQRYIFEPVPASAWDKLFIGVARQIEKKQDILQDYDEELTYKLRIAGSNASGRDNRISMMQWMVSCDLLLQGDVINNFNNTRNITKHNYYFGDQGLMYLALLHSREHPTLAVNRGNISGMLAENFVALCLREVTLLLSYARKDDEIDFILRRLSDDKLISVEVKFTEGDTISSIKALNSGYIAKIIKIQKKAEDSTNDITVYPLQDMDKFGEFLGYPKSYNLYTKSIMDVFNLG